MSKLALVNSTLYYMVKRYFPWPDNSLSLSDTVFKWMTMYLLELYGIDDGQVWTLINPWCKIYSNMF